MNCARCGGATRIDDDGDRACVMCGHKSQIAEVQPAQGLEITIRLRPKNLPELYAAVATAEGKTTSQLLRAFGLSPADAKKVASGAMVHPGVALAMMQKYTITATDFVALMKAGAISTASSAAPQARRKPVPKPKNTADAAEAVSA